MTFKKMAAGRTEPGKTDWRIHVRWVNGNPLTPKDANDREWHINWYGIQP